MTAPPTPFEPEILRQEDDVVASRAAAVTAVVALVVAGVAVIAACALLASSSGSIRPPSSPVPPPVAAIEQTPILRARTGIDERTREERELESWGWADRDAGLAVVPIDVAMDLVTRGTP